MQNRLVQTQACSYAMRCTAMLQRNLTPSVDKSSDRNSGPSKRREQRQCSQVPKSWVPSCASSVSATSVSTSYNPRHPRPILSTSGLQSQQQFAGTSNSTFLTCRDMREQLCAFNTSIHIHLHRRSRRNYFVRSSFVEFQAFIICGVPSRPQAATGM